MNNYDIMRIVGMGNYGEVVITKNKSDGEVCVIKILVK